MSHLSNIALKLLLKAADLTTGRSIRRAARDTANSQWRTLSGILEANAGTVFGKQHGFDRLNTTKEFQAAVPVQTHESLAPAIQIQAESDAPELTIERPAFYARTSGTAGLPKDIPVTRSVQRQQRRHQMLTAIALSRSTGFFHGDMAGFSSPSVEGHLASGQPYGSASGQTRDSANPLIRRRIAIPGEVAEVGDYETKYYLYSLLSLARPRLSGMITANPSTVMKVLDTVQDRADELLTDLAEGGRSLLSRVGNPLGDAVARALDGGRERAREIGHLLIGSGNADFSALWPDMKTLVTWTGGSCGIALDAVRTRFGEGIRCVELGYRASEFTGAVPVDARRNLCLPTLTDVFFEFVDRSAIDREQPDFLQLHELEQDSEYYIFATTAGGLYRYDINDIVRVDGFVGDCPCISFVQKGRGITSITGEKLAEAQVIETVAAVLCESGLTSPFYSMAADEQAALYRLYLELPLQDLSLVAEKVDEGLQSRNIEYREKRRSGRLGALAVQSLPAGAGEAIKQAAVAAGQRESQYKPVALGYLRDLPAPLLKLAARRA